MLDVDGQGTIDVREFARGLHQDINSLLTFELKEAARRQAAQTKWVRMAEQWYWRAPLRWKGYGGGGIKGEVGVFVEFFEGFFMGGKHIMK